MNQTLPFQLVLSGKNVLLIGSGDAANAKERLLTERKANVIRWKVQPSHSDIVAISQLNESPDTRISIAIIAEEAPWTEALVPWIERERILLNMVDRPEKSSGYIPAIVSRGPVQIGIGTGGVSPVLARLIRTRIEQLLPKHLARLGRFASDWQGLVRTRMPNVNARRRFWERFLSGVYAEKVLNGDLESANIAIQRELDNDVPTKGFVSLVGAGPGDPGYLTLTGLKRLQEADVVLYDRLIGEDVLELARRDAVFEDVGKRRGACPTPQHAICKRLIELAEKGLNVCRLKGGDPYLFGRGGEEALALSGAGIPFEVVPGITTASAVSARLGIPLTHRKTARSVRFITGHLALNQIDTDWSAVADSKETLVIYMGFHHLDEIAKALMAAGLSPSLPIALIQNATHPTEITVFGNLSDTSDLRSQINFDDGPVLVVVGEVTKLSERLANTSFTKTSHSQSGSALYWLKSA